jgi:ATP-dependent Clp protease ATP-binding subunit ClpX
MIEGLEGYICMDCLDAAMENKPIDGFDGVKIMTPHEIKQALDKYVIAQDDAKKKLAVEVYNHYKRINKKTSVELPKSNILMIGPSGSGKTYLMEKLSEILNVPLVIGDAPSLTEAGYVGKDVDDLLYELIDKADGDVEKAEQGIVYIDEIDKISGNATDGASTKDVGGTGVQKALLTILGGTDYMLPKTGDTINTRNILFVCGGAFEGLDKIIEKRCKKTSHLGFACNEVKEEETEVFDKEHPLRLVNSEDLKEYGLIREFVGRMHLIVTLEKLTEDDLKNILIKPKNSIIKQYQALLRLDGVKLKFSKDSIDYIVKEAIKKGTGARGLNGILSDRLNDLMYDAPEGDKKEYTITKEYLQKK